MAPTIPSEEIIVALCQLHPPLSGLVFPPIVDYELEHTFVLDKTLFAQALTIIPHLFSSEFFRMVYEHFLG
jgi:hypothetical protein